MTEDRSVLTRSAPPPDSVVSYGTAPEHVADVRAGDERASSRPLLVVIHGGFWRPTIDRAHTGPMSAALAAAGWTVASIEYRRIPGAPDLTVQDVALALKTLPGQVSRHDGRVVVVGHSAGGHLALWAAAATRTPPLHAALALSPAADLQFAQARNLGDGAAMAFLGADARSRPDLDPARMPAPEVGVTIIHGDADEVVPVELSESYVAAQPQTRLVKLRATGHFAVIDPLSEVWPTVLSELERLVG